jgi:hypothetical protein
LGNSLKEGKALDLDFFSLQAFFANLAILVASAMPKEVNDLVSSLP